MNEKLLSVFSYYSAFAEELKPQRPWRSGSWLWATQGHVLVGFHDDGSEADEPPDKYKAAGAKYLDDSLVESLRAVSVSALRRFAGPVTPNPVPCDECHGSGRSDSFGDEPTTCEHCGQPTRSHCPACGGDGKGWIQIRHARVAGLPINCSLLAFALSVIPDDEDAQLGMMPAAVASTKREKPYPALAIRGASWRIVLMGVITAGADAPSFLSEPPIYADAVDPVGRSDHELTPRV